MTCERVGRDEHQYYLLNLDPTASLTDLVTLARSRWPIEQQYRELKDDLGLDRFEGRSHRGWGHHVVLTAVAFLFRHDHGAYIGLGTAVLMVYIMRCCDPAHKAAHMAILTALMSVSFTIAGVCSGFLAEAMGFAHYFLFTFLVTIPSMALIFFLPHLDERAPARGPGASSR